MAEAGQPRHADLIHKKTVTLWGLPIAALTRAEAVSIVAELIQARRPSFFITANAHYAMLAYQMPELLAINEKASFIVADGHPLVWASRMRGTPLPERVTGSDLIFDLCKQAAECGHRIFLHGGAPGIAERAANELTDRYPGLIIAGTECPPFGTVSDAEHEAMIERIRQAKPDLLFVASSMPKGEIWLAQNLERLGIPVVVNVGASLDFAAGRIQRAPRWVQKIGMEWAFRMSLEPQRLAPRYARNASFLFKMVAADLISAATNPPLRKNSESLTYRRESQRTEQKREGAQSVG